MLLKQLVRRFAATFSALVLLLFPLAPAPHADPLEPRRPETTEPVPELPGAGLSPVLLAAIGGYLLTGGLALLLLRR